MVDQIERELLVPAPADEVWRVVTSPGWLADEVQLELVPGGQASFGCEEWTKQGWVEEAIVPGSEGTVGEDRAAGRLAFWWSADGEPATRVELTLEPEGEGWTRLRVVEARPLEMLDLVGIPLPGTGRGAHGPAMLVAA